VGAIYRSGSISDYVACFSASTQRLRTQIRTMVTDQFTGDTESDSPSGLSIRVVGIVSIVQLVVSNQQAHVMSSVPAELLHLTLQTSRLMHVRCRYPRIGVMETPERGSGS
jgi:hypothetical protein